MNTLTGDIVDAAMTVHSALGPGLLESAYEACLGYELTRRGHCVETQAEMPIMYDGQRIDAGYRLDLLVDRWVVVELKAVEKLMPVHQAQLMSYLKLGGYEVGLLFNFHVKHLKDGIKRILL